MSEWDAADFLAEIDVDQDLANKIEEMQSADEVISLASEFGYSLTLKDLQAVTDQSGEPSGQEHEFDDEQLDRVVGGTGRWNGILRRNGCLRNAVAGKNQPPPNTLLSSDAIRPATIDDN